MTKLNESILQLINESEGHLTAEQVFLLAKSKGVAVSMASTYRILNKLADEKLIKRISVPNKTDIFDKSTHEHGHLICSKCGKIKDFSCNNFKEKISQELKIDIETYDLCVRYICEDCKNKNQT